MTLSAGEHTSSTTASGTPGADSSYTIHLFSDTRTTGATMNPFTIYAVKIYKAGTLVRSFIPVIDNNDVACMFDEVSRTFFYNQGTGNFAFIELDEPELTRVSYLEATGSQYIDTGILPRNYKVFKSEVELAVTTLSTAYYWGENWGYWFGTATNNTWTIGDGKATGTVTGQKQSISCVTTASSLTDTSCTIQLTVDGTATTTRTLSGSRLNTNGTYFSIYAHNASTGQSPFKAKVYVQKLYGEGVLVADMVPALDASNVPCMYDKVRKQYFYNAGTGSFVW